MMKFIFRSFILLLCYITRPLSANGIENNISMFEKQDIESAFSFSSSISVLWDLTTEIKSILYDIMYKAYIILLYLSNSNPEH